MKSDQKLGDATRRKRIAITKQMMRSAVKARLIVDNPFRELKTASLANKSRQYFVTHQEAQKVFSACSNAEWRALVALGRYGALRVPSEVREMKCEDINWAEDCFRVHAPKTEHHADEGDRIVPLFPEVRKYLWELHEQTQDGEVYVLPNLRHTTNVLPTLQRIIKRAGLKVWPKGWQNMRATRATELENQFGAHKATEWCGHTQKIAEAHYWMVTADDIAQAAGWQSGANVVQQVDADPENASQTVPEPESKNEKNQRLPGVAKNRGRIHIPPVGPEGLEPPTNEL
jgi:integrase